MKSVREIIELLEQTLSGSKNQRRFQRKNRQQAKPEALEPRLLLTADLADSLYSPLSASQIGPDTQVENYIVAFTEGQDINQLQQATDAVSVTESEFIPNAYTLNFGDGLNLQDAADRIASLDDFQYLHPDVLQQFVPNAIPNDPLFSDQWHLINTGQGGGLLGTDINVESVWDNFTGEGVTIAIVDDGFQHTHPDLAPNARTDIDFDWNGNDDDPLPVADSDNHGTSVGGVAGAAGNNGIGVSGSSWNADLVGLRLIAGPVSDQDIAEALTHEQDIIDIYNNSWGAARNGAIGALGPQTQAALAQSAQFGRDGLGNIQVFSAGNGRLSSDNVNYRLLQNSRHTIAIGALGNDGTRADYSTLGASIVVVAPSNGGSLGITTTDREGALGYSPTDYADDFGGTSSAAPLVSGVIGLILEANPDLTYRDVTNILIRSAEQVDVSNADWVQNGDGLWVNHEYGFGNIDAAAAVDLALNGTLLGEEESFEAPRVIANQAIADNGAAVTSSYTVAADDGIDNLEYVEVVFNATHEFIGDLEVILTSPSGTESVLAEVRATDAGTSYPDWTFTTNRNWGEDSTGTWTLSVRDGADLDVGTFNSFQLRFFGSGDPGPIVAESSGNTIVQEFGLSDTVAVSLASAPASNVVLDVAVSDETEVSVDQTQLLFTPTNWQIPQTVTVSGVLDFEEDGDQVSNLTFSVNDALSDDSFDNFDDIVVAVTTLDNDFNVPGVPELTAPAQVPGTSSPRFEWTQAVNGATYSLSIQNLRTGTVVLQADGLTRREHVFALPFFDGFYEATVVATGATGIEGPPSDPLRFAIGDVLIPSAPLVTSPSIGERIDNSFPTFRWNTVAEAFSYEIEVQTSDALLTQIIEPTSLDAAFAEFQFVEALSEGDATVRVRGLNALGQPGTWSPVTTFLVDAVATPGRPTLTQPDVSVTGNAFPTFAWVAPGGSTYQLWVGQTPDDPANGTAASLNNRVIHLRNHTSLDYTHFLALDDGNYVAWVRSFNEAGEPSAWSLPVSFEVDVPIPSRPVITQVIDNGTRPTIQWDTTGDEFPPNSTFHLWVNNLTTGESRVIQERTLTTTSFTPSVDLAPGRYRAWVQVTTPVGITSAWSVPVDFAVEVAPPGNTTVLGPVPLAGETEVVTDTPTFSWTAADNAATYELWVNNTTLGITRIINEFDLVGTSFTTEDSLPQGTYKVWVRALNAAGDVGEWSAPLTFTLDILGPAVPTVTGPASNQVGTVTTATPTITWTTLGGAAAYNLELQTAADEQLVLSESGLTEEQFTVGFELAQTTYRVRVQAVNTAGEVSAFSEWFSFRIDVANPTTPVALTPTGTVISNTVEFTWTQELGSVRHEILVRDLLRQETVVFQVATGASGGGSDIASFEAQLANGAYRFWVRGFNSQDVASGWSNSRAFSVDGDDLVSLDADSDLLLTSLKSNPVEEAEVDQPAQSAQPQYVVAEAGSKEAAEQPKVSQPAQEVQTESESVLEAVLAEFADPASAMVLNREV
ncbi:MAG: S8 family serine peptidase [Fuerstiella sp.]